MVKRASVVVLFSIVVLLVGALPAAATSCGNLNPTAIGECESCCVNQYSNGLNWIERIFGGNNKKVMAARKCLAGCHACGLDGALCT